MVGASGSSPSNKIDGILGSFLTGLAAAPRAGFAALLLVEIVAAFLAAGFALAAAGFGVTRVDPLGQMFDPVRHEAVTMVPTGESERDGMVVGVLAPGYLVGDDVLRAATVAVARLSEALT